MGIDFMKTNKHVLNWHKANLYSSQNKNSTSLTTDKTQVVQVFVIAEENTWIQSKNKCSMKIRLADENGEEIAEMDILVKAIKDFELKTGLLLADYIISMKNSSSLTKMHDQTDAPVSTKLEKK